MGDSCYSWHSPPSHLQVPVRAGKGSSPHCASVREHKERNRKLPALLFPSTFTSFSVFVYFWDKQSHVKVNVALT